MGFLIGRFDQRQRIFDLCPSNSLCRMEKSLQAAINPVSTFLDGFRPIRIEVRSGRVVFTIELERNITILRGDSATGKTTLVEMLQAYETYGRQSGVTVSCDKPCRVLSGVNWELQLNATHDSIVFVDEGSTFVSSLDFARAIQHSDNYYVLVTREDLSTLPYSVNAFWN